MFLLSKSVDSLHWYLAAAEKGHAEAQFEVGCYYKSRRNTEKALTWFKKADDNGFARAKYEHGLILYNIGEMMKEDSDKSSKKEAKEKLKQGKDLIASAAKQGDPTAKVVKSLFDFDFCSMMILPFAIVFGLMAIFATYFLHEYICLDQAKDIVLIIIYCLAIVVTIVSLLSFVIVCAKYYILGGREKIGIYRGYAIAAIVWILVLLMGTVLLPSIIQPKFVSSYIQYEEQEDGTIAVWSVDLRKEEIIIPEEIDGKQVTAVKNPPTAYDPIALKNKLKKLVLPSSVKSFKFNYAIDNLSVEMAEGTTSISPYMFYNTTVSNVKIPDGVTSIGVFAFAYCGNLRSVYIPSSVERIDSYVFSACKNLTIYCEAESQPSEWMKDWNSSGCEVVWGYKG